MAWGGPTGQVATQEARGQALEDQARNRTDDSYGDNSVSNQFTAPGMTGPSKNEKYYVKVDRKTGQTTVYNEEFGPDKEVGVYNPKTNQREYNENWWGGARGEEKEYFSSPEGRAQINRQATTVARKEWDGKTQPSPTQLLYGEDADKAAYDDTEPSEIAKDWQETGKLPADLSPQERVNYSQGIPGGRSVLVYPTSMREDAQYAQDFLKFDMLEYEPRTVTGGGASQGFGFGDRDPLAGRSALGTCMLPIPGGITSNDAVGWSGQTMSAVDIMKAQLALAGIEGGFEALGQEAGDAMKKIQTNSKDVKDALSKHIAGELSGAGAQLLTRATGQIMNPNMELLFKEPTLRPFTFRFKMVPRDQKEAEVIIAILRFFKQGMAAKKSTSNLFLKSPNTWRISYNTRDEGGKATRNKYLNKFKECALKQLGVEYTPDGTYTTYNDGVMVAYQMTMQFQEIEPVYSNDYGDGWDEIGF